MRDRRRQSKVVISYFKQVLYAAFTMYLVFLQRYSCLFCSVSRKRYKRLMNENHLHCPNRQNEWNLAFVFFVGTAFRLLHTQWNYLLFINLVFIVAVFKVRAIQNSYFTTARMTVLHEVLQETPLAWYNFLIAFLDFIYICGSPRR